MLMGSQPLIHYLLLKGIAEKVNWRSHHSSFLCLTTAKMNSDANLLEQLSVLATAFVSLECLAPLIFGTYPAAHDSDAASPQAGLPWHGRQPGAIYKLISMKYGQVL